MALRANNVPVRTALIHKPSILDSAAHRFLVSGVAVWDTYLLTLGDPRMRVWATRNVACTQSQLKPHLNYAYTTAYLSRSFMHTEKKKNPTQPNKTQEKSMRL